MPVGEPGDDLDGVLDPLVGHDPAEDHEPRFVVPVHPGGQRRLGAVVDDGDPSGLHAELGELVAGAA